MTEATSCCVRTDRVWWRVNADCVGKWQQHSNCAVVFGRRAGKQISKSRTKHANIVDGTKCRADWRQCVSSRIKCGGQGSTELHRRALRGKRSVEVDGKVNAGRELLQRNSKLPHLVEQEEGLSKAL